MVDIGRLNVDADADQAAHLPSGKLQSVDGTQEGRPKPISARAG
jgi:hypothetical protein